MEMLKSLTRGFFKGFGKRGFGVGRLCDGPGVARVWAEPLESRAMLAAVVWDGGGDGVNWTSAGNWSNGAVPGADDDITINLGGDVKVSTPLTINGSLTVVGTLVFWGGSQSISGTGDVVLSGSSIYLGYSDAATNLTLGSGLTLSGWGGFADYHYSGSTLINNGTIDADKSGETLSLNAGTTVTNNGVLTATGGGTLYLGGPVTNESEISASGTSSVQINGAVTQGAEGTIGASDTAEVKIGGSIIGGSVSGAGGTGVNFTGNGTLDGVTILGQVGVAEGTALFIKNGLTVDGTLAMGPSANLIFWGGDQAISGTGTVSLSSNLFLGYSDGPTNLTVDAGVTIDGMGGVSIYNFTGNKLINNGTIHANLAGETLTIFDGTMVTNNAVMKATGGGTLALGGPVTNESEITGSGTSTVHISGTVTHGSKGTITTSDTAGLKISGSVVGGTITNGTKSGIIFSGSGTLDGVTISGDASVLASNDLYIKNGLTLNGTLTFNKTSNLLFNGGDQAISGSGTITLAGLLYLGYLDLATNLTLGSGITINGAGGVSYYHYTGNKLINNGTIHADTPEETLGIFSGITVTNNHVMKATDGATLSLVGEVINETQITGSGTSTVHISGTVTHGSKGSIVMSDTAGLVVTGTVVGGTISNGSASAAAFSGSGTLDGVTFSGKAEMLAGNSVFIKNGLTVNGTFTMGAGASLFFWGGDHALLGAGTITVSGVFYLGYLDAPSNLTVGPGITINGKGSMTYYHYSGDKLINNGTIHADLTGESLYIASGIDVTNNGVMKATDGATLTVDSMTENAGILEHLSGGVFTVAGSHVPTTGVEVSTSLAQTGKTVTFTATVSPASGTATGTVDFYNGTTLLGSGTLGAGVATFSTSGLAAGVYEVTAAYAGNGTYINNRSHHTGLTVVNAIQVTATEAISSPRTTAVGSWDVTFNELIDVTSFNWQSVTLTRNGGANLINAGTGVSIAHVSGKTYRISGLAGVTGSAGSYTLRLVAGGVEDMHGFATTASASRTWTMNQPTFTSMSAYPTPRTAPVLTPAIRLSEVANLSTFTLADLTLTRDGGANLATGGSGITITQNPGDLTLYTINIPLALASEVGNYSLTVTGAGVENGSGVVFAGTRTTTWTLIAGVPSAPVLDAASEGKVGSGYTQYSTPTMKGTASPGSTVEVYEGAVLKGSGVVAGDGKYSVTLSTLAAGVHVLKARATDGLGTVTGYSAESTITVETANPVIANMSSYSAPRTVPVGSTGIRFSSLIDTSTFNADDITMTRDGVPVSVSGVYMVVSGSDPKLYTIVVPPASNTPDGVYVLTVHGAGIKNLAGKTVTNNFSTTWTTLPQIMNMSQYTAPRSTPVTAPGIRFSNPITLSTFTFADITLTRNGGANLATSGITVVQNAVDSPLYTILIPSGLTSLAGTYVLTVNGAGITSPNGFTVSNNMSTTWVKT